MFARCVLLFMMTRYRGRCTPILHVCTRPFHTVKPAMSMFFLYELELAEIMEHSNFLLYPFS